MGDLNSTPRTWVTGEVTTAAEFNTEVKSPLTTIQAAWGTFACTTTGITLGNGTVASTYNRVGKTIEFRIVFTFGSTSAITGSITLSLPTAALVSGWCGWGDAFDTSAAAYYGISPVATSTTVLTVKSASAAPMANLSSTVPMTWAVGDVLTVQGRYETA